MIAIPHHFWTSESLICAKGTSPKVVGDTEFGLLPA